MNSKTTSILAVVCRIGKLIGALFTIIGMLVLIGTLTGLFKPEQSNSSYGYDDYYGYNYGWNSMEFPDGGDISSSREFLSDRSMISWASSSYEQMFVFDGFAEATPANLSGGAYSQMSALNSITGSLNFMCAGAFVMFFSSIGAFIFDLLSKKNMVGGFIDVCVGLMAFITNFMVTPSTSNMMSIYSRVSDGDYTAVTGYLAALLLLIMAAFLMFRSAFPCSALTTKKATGSAPKQPVYQNPVYAQNPYQNQYQNQYQNGAQNQYPTGGYNNGNPGGRV